MHSLHTSAIFTNRIVWAHLRLVDPLWVFRGSGLNATEGAPPSSLSIPAGPAPPLPGSEERMQQVHETGMSPTAFPCAPATDAWKCPETGRIR